MTLQPKWGSIIAVSLLVIGVATLTPETTPRFSPTDLCTRWCGDTILVDFLLNIALFVPLGFAVRRVGLPTWSAIAAGSAVSLIIELLQLRIISGRDASALDWIANSLGTALGVLLAARSETFLRPTPATARRLVLGAAFVWLLMSIVGAWAIRPAASDALQWGQRTPDLADTAPFEGELLSARVNGHEIPSGPLPNSDELRALMREGTVRVDATIRPGPPSQGLTSLVRVADGQRREILMLGQYHQDVVFKVRLHATDARMETPVFALSNALPASSSTAASTPSPGMASVAIAAVVEHGRVRLSVTRNDATRSTNVTLSPSLMWSFFIPWDYRLGPSAPMLTALWIGGLLIPVGYWASRVGADARGHGVVAVPLMAVAASLALVPLAFALPPTPWSHWLWAICGVGVGWGLGRSLAAA